MVWQASNWPKMVGEAARWPEMVESLPKAPEMRGTPQDLETIVKRALLWQMAIIVVPNGPEMGQKLKPVENAHFHDRSSPFSSPVKTWLFWVKSFWGSELLEILECNVLGT